MLTHREEFCCRLTAMSPHLVALQYRNVFFDLRVQELTTCFVSRFPDILEGSGDVRRVYNSAATLVSAQRITHLEGVELSAHRVAVHPGHETDMVGDYSSLFPLSFRRQPRPKMLLKDVLFGRHIHMAPR